MPPFLFARCMQILLLFLFVLSVNCTSMESQKRKPITQVIDAHKSEWMKMSGVVGVGETEKAGKGRSPVQAIMIMVDTLTPALKKKLPTNVDGYPVVIEEVGAVHPLSK